MSRPTRTKEDFLAENKRKLENNKGNYTSGGNKRQHMDYSKVEGGVEFLNPEAKTSYLVDIIPFTVTSKKFPGQHNGESYDLQLWIHQNIGPNNEWHVCPKKNYGKPCPICDDIKAKFAEGVFADGKDEDYKRIKPKRRSIMVMRDRKDDNKIKVFDYPQFYFSHNLAEKIDNLAEDEEYRDLYDLTDEGYSVRFVPSKSEFASSGGDKVYAGNITDITFIQREDYSLPDSLVDEVPALDQCVNVLPYDELKAIYYAEEDFDDDMDDGDEDTFATPPSETIARNTTIEEEVKEAENVAPVMTRAERIVAAKKAEEPSTSKCPYGHVFGADNYEYDDCTECATKHGDLIEACMKAFDTKG